MIFANSLFVVPIANSDFTSRSSDTVGSQWLASGMLHPSGACARRPVRDLLHQILFMKVLGEESAYELNGRFREVILAR
jgi:hypothetical protein